MFGSYNLKAVLSTSSPGQGRDKRLLANMSFLEGLP